MKRIKEMIRNKALSILLPKEDTKNKVKTSNDISNEIGNISLIPSRLKVYEKKTIFGTNTIKFSKNIVKFCYYNDLKYIILDIKPNDIVEFSFITERMVKEFNIKEILKLEPDGSIIPLDDQTNIETINLLYGLFKIIQKYNGNINNYKIFNLYISNVANKIYLQPNEDKEILFSEYSFCIADSVDIHSQEDIINLEKRIKNTMDLLNLTFTDKKDVHEIIPRYSANVLSSVANAYVLNHIVR